MLLTYEIVAYDPFDYSCFFGHMGISLVFFHFLKNLVDDLLWEFEESLRFAGDFPIDLSQPEFIKMVTQKEGKRTLPALSIELQ